MTETDCDELDSLLARGLRARLAPTPLLPLPCLHRFSRVPILAKAEFEQPGGSIKDRTALGMILAAEASGRLPRGGTIIDATAGNTGIGLALHGRERGHKTVVVIPNGISREKVALLTQAGASVREAAPNEDYRELARVVADKTPGAWWVNQFDNLDNRRTHFVFTGPEIWEQTGGRLSAFVAAAGTGGTLVGTSSFLKSRNDQLRCYCAEPTGAVVWSWVKHGRAAPHGPESIAEGIGQSKLTGNMAGTQIDDAVQIPDAVAIAMLTLLREEASLCVGLSAAINVCASVYFARRLPANANPVVTILCDCGNRYLSTLHNPDWLASRHLLPTPSPVEVLERFFANED